MAAFISYSIPYLVLISHIVFVFLFLNLIFRNSWGKRVSKFLGDHSILLAFLVAVASILGSLFYSEIVGFEPCVLCWWQRVFLYPLAIIFLVSVWKKIDSVFIFALPFTIAAALIAAYQSYASLGGVSLLPCTAAEGACSKIYVMAFGYITIPLMSLTVSLYILLLAWAHRIFSNENSNS